MFKTKQRKVKQELKKYFSELLHTTPCMTRVMSVDEGREVNQDRSM